MRLIWLGAGYLAVGLGLAGAALPMLPTVPFLILALFCFSRSSPRLHNWLMEHPRWGQALRDWSERGAIPRRAKLLALTMMAGSFAVGVAVGLPVWALAVQGAVLLAVSGFILTRPER